MKYKLKPRKILSINYTYFISLPQDWLINHSISKGDKLSLVIGENQELILLPEKETKNETTQTN